MAKNIPAFVGLRLNVGGKFDIRNSHVIWSGGKVILEGEICSKSFTVGFLNQFVMDTLKVRAGEYKIWYRKSGKNLTTGRKVMIDQSDIDELFKRIDKADMVTVYVVFEGDGWQNRINLGVGNVGPKVSQSLLVGCHKPPIVNAPSLSQPDIPIPSLKDPSTIIYV